MSSRLIGQKPAETLLARAVATSRVGHAYLFLGPSGAGKTTAAFLFAEAIECERQPAARQEGDFWRLEPCGACPSCRRIRAGTHPEVMAVRPESKGGQNISVDQAREIRKNASLRPKLGSRRIYIIPNAEAFSEPSANALLKTLEEPSEFVTLILAAPNPSQVLPTIRSRCQLIRFGLAPAYELTDALVAAGQPEETAGILARASGGLPGLALSWATDPSVLEQRRQVFDLFALTVTARVEASPTGGVLALRLAEQLRGMAGRERETGETPARAAKSQLCELLGTAESWLRDLLLLVGGAEPELLHNLDRAQELKNLAARVPAEHVVRDLDTVREAEQLLDRNANPQLVLERMFWALIAGPLPVPGRPVLQGIG